MKQSSRLLYSATVLIIIVILIGFCSTQATAQDSLEHQLLKAEWKLRVAESNLEVAKSQFKTLNKRIEGLKSDSLRLASNAAENEQLYNECLDDVLDKILDLQSIAFIVGEKRLPVRKVKQVKDIIDDKN